MHCRDTLLGMLTLSGRVRRPAGLPQELLGGLQVQIEIKTMDRGGNFLADPQLACLKSCWFGCRSRLRSRPWTVGAPFWGS